MKSETNSDKYVDTEPSNWRCYHCGHVSTYIHVNGGYKCENCGQMTLTDAEGSERHGQLKDE